MNCGAENPAGKKFCTECGTPLALACPACGAAIAGTEKFCGECGSRLGGRGSGPGAQALSAPTTEPSFDTADAESARLVAERRFVSVLFADLVGFTTASERRDAEDTREFLSRYFELCRRLIELYGGLVEKFIGDAVVAVWGAPLATEDDPERAVRAALELVAAVQALGEEAGDLELRARAGVLSGEAAVTLGGSVEAMVAGDLVNTASRVQAAAPPGGVLVGEGTRRATDQTVAYEPAGNFELKGKSGLDARATFEQLGAEPWLARIEALEAVRRAEASV